MRAWWSMLLVPNMDANLRNICETSLLCFDEPTQNTASGPLSLRICSSLSPISLIACSQLMRRYLPSTSFIGYLRRCEFSVMPCSRMPAPLAQCAPRLIGESNTGSWRTHTPFSTTASIEQPTEQCVHTVRLISTLPLDFVASARASPIMLSGNWLAKAAAPAATPEPLRNARRAVVFGAIEAIARASGLTGWTDPSDLRVSSMAASSDFGGLVVLEHVRGGAIAVLRCRLRLGARLLQRGARLHHERGSDTRGAESCTEEELAAVGRGKGLFHRGPPVLHSSLKDSASSAANAAASAATWR